MIQNVKISLANVAKATWDMWTNKMFLNHWHIDKQLMLSPLINCPEII